MIKLIEFICTYYVIGILVSTARSIPPEEFGYNSFMWGPVLGKKLYYSFISYLARFQAEIMESLDQEQEQD